MMFSNDVILDGVIKRVDYQDLFSIRRLNRKLTHKLPIKYIDVKTSTRDEWSVAKCVYYLDEAVGYIVGFSEHKPYFSTSNGIFTIERICGIVVGANMVVATRHLIDERLMRTIYNNILVLTLLDDGKILFESFDPRWEEYLDESMNDISLYLELGSNTFRVFKYDLMNGNLLRSNTFRY